eukprot:1162116-Pelagomonas_calceolata.AAC.4
MCHIQLSCGHPVSATRCRFLLLARVCESDNSADVVCTDGCHRVQGKQPEVASRIQSCEASGKGYEKLQPESAVQHFGERARLIQAVRGKSSCGQKAVIKKEPKKQSWTRKEIASRAQRKKHRGRNDVSNIKCTRVQTQMGAPYTNAQKTDEHALARQWPHVL